MIAVLNGTRETVAYDENIGVRLYLNQQNEDYPIHWHTAAEIIMPIENTYEVEVNTTRYLLNVDDIILLPSGELHQLYAPKEGKRIIFQFDYSLLYTLNGFDSIFPMFHPCSLITKETLPDVHGELRNLILEIRKEYFSDSPFKEASIYSYLVRFFVILGRSQFTAVKKFPNAKNPKRHEYIDKFLMVCTYINEHCTETINVADLAALAGFSKYHFMRLFKEFSGISYYDYLHKQRIMHAEKLLIDPNLTITEIAMHSGFNSLATFNRIFKEQKNCTPSEYKRLHGANLRCINPAHSEWISQRSTSFV